MNNTFKSTKVVYLGFNSMLKHKRGVENVIDFQSKASSSSINYYIHWDNKTEVYHYNHFLCIGIKNNIFRFIVLNWFLLKIKKKEKSLLIHSHNTLMSMMSLFQTHLFTVHDALYYQTKSMNHKLKSVFYFLELFLYKRTRFVHFISNYTKKMSLYSKKNNFIIIPNTSYLEGFNNNTKKDNNEIVKFNPDATKVFLVRSIEERACIDLVIQVATQLKETNFEFLIAGKGPLYDIYNSQIKKLNLTNIKLLGYVSDSNLIDYYSDCDLVLMPAAYGEGFGLPIIEGYLFNKPVIASNKCAIPEVIYSPDFLFENTVESIIEKLNFIKTNLKGDYKEYYANNFSNLYVMNKFNVLYKSLV